MVPEDVHPPHAPLQQDPDTMDATSDHPEAPRGDLAALPLARDCPESDEEIMLDGASLDAPLDAPVRIYTPPPHIAARFYRQSAQACRKSSAASSRRNSISSNHSRSSHGYGLANSSNNAPQSKHIAQHLRRASILADRKARLADRAAHAEQVRLRAAMAKAAVRDISQSEERALAAALAREKKLEEIAAACAEEVKRAKAIAETIKEKREQDLTRLRRQIQDRLDEAERRRDEMRRTNGGRTRTRGHSILDSRKHVDVMPEVAELKETSSQEHSDDASPGAASQSGRDSPSRETPAPALTPEEAAYKILHWWRRASRKRAISKFQELGLAIDSVRDTSFEEVADMLAQDSVLMTTGKILQLCGIQQGKTSSVNKIVVNRTFLSAFLILGHPTQVLSNNETQEAAARLAAGSTLGNAARTGKTSVPIGKDDLSNPQLQDLVGKAKDLLICFETIVSRLSHANNYTPPASLASELVEAYDSFYDAFIAWKARDASALVDVMVMQFVELDAIWQTVKDGSDPSVSDTYRESIQQNQLLLMVRIKKLAGPEEGKKKIFDAVYKARRAKGEARRKAVAANTNSEMRPRETDHTLETAMGDLTGLGGSNGNGNNGNGNGNSNAKDGSTSSLSSGIRRPGIPPAKSSNVVSDAAISGMLPQSKPSSEASAEAKLRGLRFAPADEKYSSSPLPENRVVVHELAVDHKFRVSSTQFKQQQAAWMEPVFHRMRKTMNGSTRAEQEEHFYYLLTIAECIRSKLERLTVPGRKMHQFIGELLDTEIAQRQFAMGSFSYERFCTSIGQLLPKLCAPVRDDEVKELIEVTLKQGDYVDGLQALLSFIDVMLTDHVNFMISVAAPRLLASATEYEARRFAELVGLGDSGNPESLAVEKQLPAAMAVWRSARSKVLAEAAKRDPEGINHPKARPNLNHFYTQMLIDVFTQLSPIRLDEMPEMLRLDHARALKWGALTRRVVTAGAVLLQCKNLLKRDVRLPWKTEAHRVMLVLEKAEKDAAGSKEQQQQQQQQQQQSTPELEAVRVRAAFTSNNIIDGVVAALESGRSMPSSTKANLRTIVQRTMAASAEVAVAQSTTDSGRNGVPQEPVLRLLLHRLRSFLSIRLTISTTNEKTRQSNAANERLTGLGLAEFVDQVREMTDEVSRVGAVDRDTHVRFWEAVAEAVNKEDASASS